MSAGAKPGSGKGLRIASGCASLDEFTAVFRKFCTPTSIFIATKSPREKGLETRFAITLKDGKPVMRGSGLVRESFARDDNPYGRPGMVIEFSKLDTMGRILFDELNADSTLTAKPQAEPNFEIPTRVQDPDEEVLAASRKSGAIKVPISDDLAAAGESALPPSTPARAPGAKIILPANPFGALTATSLEAFVECTLYEETGEVDVANMVTELGRSDGLPRSAEPSLPDRIEDAQEAGFDSAPDALDSEAARAIAAAQIAEDRRLKYIPRPPTLPPIRQEAEYEPAKEPGSVAPMQRHASSAPEVLSEREDSGMPVRSAILEFLPKSVTRVQALALAVLCLVAGLGFGSFFRGSSGERKASVLAGPIRAESTGLATAEKVAEPAPAAPEPAAEPLVIPVASEATNERMDADAGPGGGTEMASAPHADDALCQLVLDVRPPESVVTAAGLSQKADGGDMQVPCGEHEVHIAHPRYQDQRSKVQARAGEASLLRARLQRPLVYLRVVSSPAKADVFINSRRVGKTPLRHKLNGFETATIELTNPGFKKYTKRVYVKKSSTLKVSLRESSRATSKRRRRTSR